MHFLLNLAETVGCLKELVHHPMHVYLHFTVVALNCSHVSLSEIVQNGQCVVLANTVVTQIKRVHLFLALRALVMYLHTPYTGTYSTHFDDAIKALLIRACFALDH